MTANHSLIIIQCLRQQAEQHTWPWHCSGSRKKAHPERRTSFLDVSTSDAGLMEVLSVYSSQRVEQGVPWGVIAPIAHVQAPNETHQPPLLLLVPHVCIGPRLGMMSRAFLVRTRAAASQLLQFVLGPLLCTPTLSLGTNCRSTRQRG